MLCSYNHQRVLKDNQKNNMNWDTSKLKVLLNFSSDPLKITGIEKTGVKLGNKNWDCYKVKVEENIIYQKWANNLPVSGETIIASNFLIFRKTYRSRDQESIGDNDGFLYLINQLGKGERSNVPFKGAFIEQGQMVFCLSEEVNDIIREERKKWIEAGYANEEDLKVGNKVLVDAKHEALLQNTNGKIWFPKLNGEERESIKKAETLAEIKELQENANFKRENILQLQRQRNDAIQSVTDYWDNSKKDSDEKINGRALEELLGREWRDAFKILDTEEKISQKKVRLIKEINENKEAEKNRRLEELKQEIEKLKLDGEEQADRLNQDSLAAVQKIKNLLTVERDKAEILTREKAAKDRELDQKASWVDPATYRTDWISPSELEAKDQERGMVTQADYRALVGQKDAAIRERDAKQAKLADTEQARDQANLELAVEKDKVIAKQAELIAKNQELLQTKQERDDKSNLAQNAQAFLDQSQKKLQDEQRKSEQLTQNYSRLLEINSDMQSTMSDLKKDTDVLKRDWIGKTSESLRVFGFGLVPKIFMTNINSKYRDEKNNKSIGDLLSPLNAEEKLVGERLIKSVIIYESLEASLHNSLWQNSNLSAYQKNVEELIKNALNLNWEAIKSIPLVVDNPLYLQCLNNFSDKIQEVQIKLKSSIQIAQTRD